MYTSQIRRRVFFGLAISLFGIALALLVASGAPARAGQGQPRQEASTSASVPFTQDAFAHWVYNGSSPTEITITVGTPIALDLFINTGSNPDATGQQSYLTFDYGLFKFVDSTQQGCVYTSTVVPDTTTFDAPIQNEICNGPDNCIFRGVSVSPGSFGFASGSLGTCPEGCGGDFRVARAAICGVAPGRGVMHWQFSPPAPLIRDSEIIALNGDNLANPALYRDLYVNVVCSGCSTSTPTPSFTPSATPTGPTVTPTRTFTPGPTFTQTPILPTSTPAPAGSATPCAMGFSDVYSTDYFYSAVRYLYCEGAISGYADGTFRPYNNTTRGQLCKIVVLAEGWPIDTTGGPHFSDVLAGSTFYDYVETAYNQGIISGYSDGTFRWGSNVTRGQLSKIVVLAEDWALVDRTVPTFSDVPVGSPFFSYVETAYCHGIISGYSDGTFRPGNNATRGQISKIVYEARAGGHTCQAR